MRSSFRCCCRNWFSVSALLFSLLLLLNSGHSFTLREGGKTSMSLDFTRVSHLTNSFLSWHRYHHENPGYRINSLAGNMEEIYDYFACTACTSTRRIKCRSHNYHSLRYIIIIEQCADTESEHIYYLSLHMSLLKLDQSGTI